ncbi:MAG TPA: tetratricopeptide repeat protein [Verrucomicrobiae bacterium]|nr:tetratricopeptide repeat protein [Verrucomicrobiae bacterium]
MNSDGKAKSWTTLVCVALAAATLVVFWGARQCQFVNYDDPAYITSNEAIRHGLTAQSVQWAFETGAASNWHPLTWLSHMADVDLYGMEPAGHHLTSVLLHAANGVLLFLILLRMTGALWRSAFVAAVFALHPLRVESVVWVSERKDVLSTFFWMLTVWAYVRYAREFKVRGSKFKVFYVLSLVFFACGLMSKPMLVTLPLVLLLLDYWPLERLAQGVAGLVKEKIPFFILAAASSVVTFLVQRHGGSVSSLTGVPVGARLGNAFISYVRYVQKLFWPARLSPLYPHPGYWPWWEVAGAVLLLTAITVWVVRRAHAQPYLAVGWFWFVVILAPTIGLVQVGIQSMADRYSYVASVGLLIMLTWGAAEWIGSRRWVLATAAALALGACAILTPRQAAFWRTSETLFTHAVDVTDNNYLAYNNLGFDLSNRGEMERAMVDFRRALEINSNYDEAHNNLGYALAALGRDQEATNEYIKALSLNSNLTEAHNNLGIALGHLGLSDAGMHEFQVALEENPRHAGAHNNLGVALAVRGRLDDAIAQFRLSIACQENYLSAHSDLGNALAMKGDLAGAIQEYEFCLSIDTKDAQVHNNLGNVLAQQGKLDEAVAQYRIALNLKAENPEAHFNLGCCLAKLGRQAEAKEQFTLALQQRPNYLQAQQQLEALQKAP